MIGYLE